MFMNTCNRKPPYFALICGMLIGLTGLYTIPYMIGNAVEQMHLSTDVAGWLATAEIVGVSIGSVIAPLLASRIPPRHLILTSAIVTVLVNLLSGLIWSSITREPLTFALVRAIAGLASGIVLGMVTAWIALLGESERIYGRVYMGMSLAVAIMLVLLPILQGQLGGNALFLALASILFILLLPLSSRLDVDKHSANAPTHVPSIAWFDVIRLFLSMTLAYFTYGAAYTFLDRIGNAIGLSSTTIGTVLSASTMTSIVGSWIAGTLGVRWGRARPLCGAILLAGLSYLLILRAKTSSMLLIGMIVYGLTTMFYNAYSLGVAVALEPTTGRIASALQGYSLIPYALGPGLLGTVASSMSFRSLALPALAINLSAILIVLPVLTRLDRESKRCAL
ncbi:hypothetical protein WL94_02265 [Burkholderia cepacia]|nr:hypothetical protein WL94_02265 [Burkholderia cepacia]